MNLYKRIQEKKVAYDLTILILSLPKRFDKLVELYTSIRQQSVNQSVQIVYLGDNKSMSVGAKRNLALSMASGKYITFVDDDDRVSDNYVAEILKAIGGEPEVIVFRVQKYRNGVKDKEQRFTNKTHRVYLVPDKSHYIMPPNHLCAWRRDVIKEEFPNKSLSEDHVWSESMMKHYQDIFYIDEILYHYYYDTSLSETHAR